MATRPAAKPKLKPEIPLPNANVIIPTKVAWGIKGMQVGTATAEQQAAVLGWIVKAVCGYDSDLSYFDNMRCTDFALGKRWVAGQILRAYNLKPEDIAARKAIEDAELGMRNDDEMPTT